LDAPEDSQVISNLVSPSRHPLIEITAAFLKLGCISFGGPVAHLGYFRHEFVEKRRWLDDATFGDIVALCQFLPGPASSQTVFALGMRRGGLVGAILASICFMAPSAGLMIGFAYGVAAIGDLRNAGWLHGLKLAAVAVVAQAVWKMGRTLCPDRPRITLALLAAAVLLVVPGAGMQVGVITAGGVAGWWMFRREIQTQNRAPSTLARNHWIAAGALVLCASLLLILPAAAAAFEQRELRIFDSFYRAGSLVFGGGHVVLPLLRAEVVPPGWIGDDAFLAGYGAAQAVPGPLFTFAGFLGTIIHGGERAWLGGAMCLFAIFLPAWLLIGGALPFWELLRSKRGTQAALRGANAAVVGVLLAALYDPVAREAVSGGRDVAFAIAAFAALEVWRVPAWLVVLLAAASGQWVV
jgi:chromate transporter